MARQTLDSWIHEALNDLTQDGPCWMITLAHMRGTSPEEIVNIKFGAKAWTAKELADIFRHKAEGYAQDLSGPQTFCMYAFYNKSTEHGAKHPFIIRGQEDLGGLGTESPDTRGLIQQGMRHTEIALGMALRHQKDVNDQMVSMFKILGEQNATLMKENVDAMSVVKEIMLAQATENREAEVGLLEYKRKTEERAKLLGLAPALANQIFGREIFPQSKADTAIIESLTESLDEEQITALMALLKPEQAALLAPRMEKVLRDKAARQQLEEHNEMDDDEDQQQQAQE